MIKVKIKVKGQKSTGHQYMYKKTLAWSPALSLCVPVCLCVCQCVCLFMSISVCLSLCVSLSLTLSLTLYVCLPLCPPSLSLSMPLSLSVSTLTHTHTVTHMLPWMFVMSHIHYCKWMAVHVRDLIDLPHKCLQTWEAFNKGLFVTQKTTHKFSMLAHDQVNIGFLSTIHKT